MKTENQACRKKGYQKIGFDFKLFIIGEIENKLLILEKNDTKSVNHF